MGKLFHELFFEVEQTLKSFWKVDSEAIQYCQNFARELIVCVLGLHSYDRFDETFVKVCLFGFTRSNQFILNASKYLPLLLKSLQLSDVFKLHQHM